MISRCGIRVITSPIWRERPQRRIEQVETAALLLSDESMNIEPFDLPVQKQLPEAA